MVALDTKPKLRAATGKQLIKAVKSSIKNKRLIKGRVDCVIGAYGEEFPHLWLSIELPNDAMAYFNIETSNNYDDYGKCEVDGGYCRTRAIKYVKVIDIKFTKKNCHLEIVREAEQVKDIKLLDACLKEIFDGMLVLDYEDYHGSYERTVNRLRE